MSYPDQNQTPAAKSGNGAILFIVGALVVAVGVLFWLFTSGGDATVSGTSAPADTTITIDNSSAPAPAAEAAPTVPAAEPAAPTPAPAGN